VLVSVTSSSEVSIRSSWVIRWRLTDDHGRTGADSGINGFNACCGGVHLGCLVASGERCGIVDNRSWDLLNDQGSAGVNDSDLHSRNRFSFGDRAQRCNSLISNRLDPRRLGSKSGAEEKSAKATHT
jgi:hypothetical protein